jgi:GxxExxY protein
LRRCGARNVLKKPPRSTVRIPQIGPFFLGTRGAWEGAMLVHLPTNELTERIIGCAMEVHRVLGPGLLENPYDVCLGFELRNAGLTVAAEHPLTVTYKGLQIPGAYRLDLVVEGLVAVEIKAVDTLLPIHTAQLLTYLRLGNYQVGLLLNFNSVLLKDVIVRALNSRFRIATEAGDRDQQRR